MVLGIEQRLVIVTRPNLVTGVKLKTCKLIFDLKVWFQWWFSESNFIPEIIMTAFHLLKLGKSEKKSSIKELNDAYMNSNQSERSCLGDTQ